MKLPGKHRSLMHVLWVLRPCVVLQLAERRVEQSLHRFLSAHVPPVPLACDCLRFSSSSNALWSISSCCLRRFAHWHVQRLPLPHSWQSLKLLTMLSLLASLHTAEAGCSKGTRRNSSHGRSYGKSRGCRHWLPCSEGSSMSGRSKS
jgi:hypothetical protein